MTDKDKAVATTLQGSAVVPTGGAPLGFEGTDMTKVSMPRVKVMQGLSPELSDPDYNFRQGDIIHGLLMEKMPDKFVPVKFWDDRILFLPRNDEDKKALFAAVLKHFNEDVSDAGQIVCRSTDAKTGSRFGSCATCPLGQWDDGSDEPPFCTQNINVLGLFDGWDMPVAIPFSNTSYKYGRKLRDMAYFSGRSAFEQKYKLVSKQEKNDKGVFFTMQGKPAGFPTDEEKAKAYDLYQRFLKTAIETEMTDDSGDVGPAEPKEY